VVGALALIVVVAACYLVFGGPIPFTAKPFLLRAVFTANTDLHIPSPVRIAGVQVGDVTGVQRLKGSRTAGVVTMRIDSSGLPIRADATARIRDRIFLEGNFYVALTPGSPAASVLHSGATLPAANTSGPVQLDRILSALNTPARHSLQTVLQGLGQTLNGQPDAAADTRADPSVRGLTAAQSLNYALKYSAGAFKGLALVNQALLGRRSGDLAGLVKGESRVFTALGDNRAQLAGLVSNFDTTMSVLADHQQALSQSVSLLPSVLQAALATDTELEAAYGPTQRFARLILPAIRQLGPTVSATLPWLGQLTALTSPSELGTLVSDLKPAAEAGIQLLEPTEALEQEADSLARCLSAVIVPTGNERISDPPGTTGEQVYQELFQAAVGVAGAAGNFDGNGRYLRASAGGGSDLVRTPALKGSGPLYGNAVKAPLGTRPKLPAKAPALKSNVSCYKQSPPDLNAAKTGQAP
jgi:ABC-type transporter Mla subunit MlaD